MKNQLLFLFLLVNTITFAQNLVKNPSFENLQATFKAKPCVYSQAMEFNAAVLNWSCEKYVTADILTFNSYGSKCFPILPRTGQRMAGFIAYHPKYDSGYTFSYHEQLQGELTKPLKVGKTYTFEYWLYTDDTLAARHLCIVLGDKSKSIMSVFCNNVGVQFRMSKLDPKLPWRDSLAKNPQQYVTTKVIENTNGWKKFQFLITPDQAYPYFYIGNFKDDDAAKTNLTTAYSHKIDSFNSIPPSISKRSKTFWERKKRIAYYCIDDVSMREGNFMDAPEPDFVEKSTYTFKNVVFQTGKAILVSASTAEINALYDFLQKNPNQKIIIQGHTDNIGTEKTNLQLSQQRAQSVATYLIEKGCASSRISTEGFGSKQPITPNDSEDGKAKNRRVEVKLL